MTNFSQDTDSQNRTNEGFSSNNHVTSDIEDQADTIRLSGESDPVKQARKIIPQIENPCVAKQLDNLLSFVNKIVSTLMKSEEDLKLIPPIHPHVEEDGSVLLQWIFPDFRVGFNIEPNPNDSGWHLVANKRLGDITASGQLTNMGEITIILLDFIRSNI
jgi:hypothetical protein